MLLVTSQSFMICSVPLAQSQSLCIISASLTTTRRSCCPMRITHPTLLRQFVTVLPTAFLVSFQDLCTIHPLVLHRQSPHCKISVHHALRTIHPSALACNILQNYIFFAAVLPRVEHTHHPSWQNSYTSQPSIEGVVPLS